MIISKDDISLKLHTITGDQAKSFLSNQMSPYKSTNFEIKVALITTAMWFISEDSDMNIIK